jgi:hypothetical protein
MRRLLVLLPLALLIAGAAPKITDAERSAIFEAAGFAERSSGWRRCEEETPAASSTPGRIEMVDLNGDGTPEAFVSETSLFCYGSDDGFVVLLVKGKGGAWRRLIERAGTYLVRKKKHGGWRDVEIGGPGTGAQPVYRWNGQGYARVK